jgi:hypothetical protein
MQLTPQPRRISGNLSIVLFFFCIFTVFIGPDTVLAEKQNTGFLPLKINSSRPAALQKEADATLTRVLAEQGLKMIPRDRARSLIDYAGSWPPSAAALRKVADKTGYDYVALGSLTRIGKGVELDMMVVDTLTPTAEPVIFQETSLDGGLD